MVLWEITVATAYFLGLKRTYRLALQIQRRLIAPKYPKIRDFAQRRTRVVFDVALKVHRNIQERDIEIGRNLGNQILRWLDKMQPSANIRGSPEKKFLSPSNVHTNTIKPATKHHQKSAYVLQRFRRRNFEQGSSCRYLFSTARNTWRRTFPSIAMMMRPPMPSGNTTQYRQLCFNSSQLLGRRSSSVFEGGIRKDIQLWMQRS